MTILSIIAADGLPRRPFTVRDVERMVEVGLIDADERVELVEGELIPMSPKGGRHEIYKTALMMHWARVCPPDMLFVPETTFRLSEVTYLEPDFVVFPKAVKVRGLTGGTSLLAVEIADTSLRYDLGRKAEVYARHRIAELWVIDVEADRMRVHREPGEGRYATVFDVGPAERVVPIAAPDAFALRLADLDLDI